MSRCGKPLGKWTPSLGERQPRRLTRTIFLALLSHAGAIAAGESSASESLPAISADRADCGGWNTRPFFEAATSGDVEECLRSGADVNAKGADGNTPLHVAASRSRGAEVIEALLAAGADPVAVSDSGSPPLVLAVCNPNPAVAAALVDSGADPTARVGMFGMTPLHYAVVCDNATVVRTLVDAGADPNARDGWGWTPLHCAGYCPREVREHDYAVHVDAAVTKALIAVGADPSIRSALGNAALHHAARGNANAAVIG